MKDKKLANLMAEFLEAIDQGIPVEEFLINHPADAGVLRELLEAATMVKSTPPAAPRARFKRGAGQRLVNKLEYPKQAVTFLEVDRLIRETLRTKSRRFAMNWLMIVTLIGGLLAGGGGVAYAAEGSLPGDLIYPVKTAIQDVRLTLSDDAGDIDLLLDIMDEDIQEVGQLIQSGRPEDAGTGLQEYQENLSQLLQTRERVNYDDMPNEEALNQRIQTQLLTQIQQMIQLKEQTADQLQVKDQLQEAIQAADNGAQYGPAEGGPGESGSPNGAGPGEPQQNQDKQSPAQGNGDGEPNGEGGKGEGGNGEYCGLDELTGEEIECENGSGGHSGPGGRP